jgi:hypothetical protein
MKTSFWFGIALALAGSIHIYSSSALSFAPPAKVTGFEVIAPLTATVGEAIDVAVRARDMNNNTVSTYQGNIIFIASNFWDIVPQSGKSIAFTPSDLWSKRFDKKVTFTKDGDQTIYVVDISNDTIVGKKAVYVYPSTKIGSWNTMCTKEYAPVCWQPCDPGYTCTPITYSNSCEMKKTGAWPLYEGVCKDSNTTEVKEMVTCFFTGSLARDNSCKGTYYVPGTTPESYSCTGWTSCSVVVKGKKGHTLSWFSSLDSNMQETILDGQDEMVIFAKKPEKVESLVARVLIEPTFKADAKEAYAREHHTLKVYLKNTGSVPLSKELIKSIVAKVTSEDFILSYWPAFATNDGYWNMQGDLQVGQEAQIFIQWSYKTGGMKKGKVSFTSTAISPIKDAVFDVLLQNYSSCIDNDKGDIYKKWWTLGPIRTTSNDIQYGMTKWQDSCINPSTLREHICLDGYSTYEEKKCQNWCDNWACKLNNTSSGSVNTIIPTCDTPEAYYLYYNPDVARDSYFKSQPKDHWNRYGQKENRKSCWGPQTVKESVTCIFSDPSRSNSCVSRYTSQYLTCSGTKSCTLSISGKEWEKVALYENSSRDTLQYATLDGKNEDISFIREVPTVKESVTCVFTNARSTWTRSTCQTVVDGSSFSCTGTKNCTVNISWKKGKNLIWTAKDGNTTKYQYSILDGVSETISFVNASSNINTSFSGNTIGWGGTGSGTSQSSSGTALSCSTQKVTWYANGHLCSGTAYWPTPSGAGGSISNLISWYTGTAKVSCTNGKWTAVGSCAPRTIYGTGFTTTVSTGSSVSISTNGPTGRPMTQAELEAFQRGF